MHKIITDKDEAHTAGLLKSGLHFVHVATGAKLYLPMLYDNRIDLDKMEYCFAYKESLPTSLPLTTLLPPATLPRRWTSANTMSTLPAFRIATVPHPSLMM